MKQNIPNIVVSASDSQALKDAARINSLAYFKAGVPDEVTIRRSDYLHVETVRKA